MSQLGAIMKLLSPPPSPGSVRTRSPCDMFSESTPAQIPVTVISSGVVNSTVFSPNVNESRGCSRRGGSPIVGPVPGEPCQRRTLKSDGRGIDSPTQKRTPLRKKGSGPPTNSDTSKQFTISLGFPIDPRSSAQPIPSNEPAQTPASS